ncbi:MAG: hypothetical protein WBN81_16900 [Gammaproteobacteria bacterium]
MKRSRLLGAVCVCMASIAGSVNAASVVEVESNDTILTAQDINASFDLSPNINVNDINNVNTSAVIPHAEVQGTGDGTFDFFSFFAGPGETVILDIDFGCEDESTTNCDSGTDFDSWIGLYDPSGILHAFNDDFSSADTGSNEIFDSFLQTTTSIEGGVWTVKVAAFPSTATLQSVVPDEADYTLNVSVTPVPVPAAVWLFGSGLLGLLGMARRKKAA